MHPKDWEGGVRAGTEAYLASPPRGEVGLLAQRARRVGSRMHPKDWEGGVRAGTEAYLASPPRGEVGQLAQRARRVGSRTNPRTGKRQWSRVLWQSARPATTGA